jgi:hypothetical protein
MVPDHKMMFLQTLIKEQSKYPFLGTCVVVWYEEGALKDGIQALMLTGCGIYKLPSLPKTQCQENLVHKDYEDSRG